MDEDNEAKTKNAEEQEEKHKSKDEEHNEKHDEKHEPKAEESEESKAEEKKEEKHEPKEHHAPKEHHTPKHHHHKPAKPVLRMKKITMWKAIAVVAVIFLIILLLKGGEDGTCDAGTAVTEGAVSAEDAGEKVMDFINKYLLDPSKEAVFKSVEEENKMFKINFEVDGQAYPSYVSTDGKILFLQEGINMEEFAKSSETPTDEPQESPKDMPKLEKPEVEVFVMSHCPYGTQMEKGLLPVAELLGDKIDFSVKFVYYAMHGKKEIDEQMNQHCIQKEQNDKFIDYLICFLDEGDGEGCLEETEIDTEALAACVEETDEAFSITEKFENQSAWMNGRFPMFDIDKELNDKYGVRGSPHLVINGESASSGRDSASLLKAVCAGFEEAPEECGTELSSTAPGPGFGFDSTGGASAGSCS